MNVHIHVDKHSIRRESLAGVAGHGVAVVEIAHLPGVKGDGFSAVHLDRDLKAVLLFGRRRDVLDCAKVAVGHSKFLVGHGELEAVAHGNIAIDLSVDRDSFQPLRVIGDPLTVWFLDGQIVLCSVNVHNLRESFGAYVVFPASALILQYVTNAVLSGPCTISSADVGSVHQDLNGMVLFRDLAEFLQALTNCQIDVAPRSVIRGNDDGVLRVLNVTVGDCFDSCG